MEDFISYYKSLDIKNQKVFLSFIDQNDPVVRSFSYILNKKYFDSGQSSDIDLDWENYNWIEKLIIQLRSLFTKKATNIIQKEYEYNKLYQKLIRNGWLESEHYVSSYLGSCLLSFYKNMLPLQNYLNILFKSPVIFYSIITNTVLKELHEMQLDQTDIEIQSLKHINMGSFLKEAEKKWQLYFEKINSKYFHEVDQIIIQLYSLQELAKLPYQFNLLFFSVDVSKLDMKTLDSKPPFISTTKLSNVISLLQKFYILCQNVATPTQLNFYNTLIPTSVEAIQMMDDVSPLLDANQLLGQFLKVIDMSKKLLNDIPFVNYSKLYQKNLSLNIQAKVQTPHSKAILERILLHIHEKKWRDNYLQKQSYLQSQYIASLGYSFPTDYTLNDIVDYLQEYLFPNIKNIYKILSDSFFSKLNNHSYDTFFKKDPLLKTKDDCLKFLDKIYNLISNLLTEPQYNYMLRSECILFQETTTWKQCLENTFAKITALIFLTNNCSQENLEEAMVHNTKLISKQI